MFFYPPIGSKGTLTKTKYCSTKYPQEGDIFTVIAHAKDYLGRSDFDGFLVEFDGPRRMLHSGEGRGKPNHCWWIYRRYIKDGNMLFKLATASPEWEV